MPRRRRGVGAVAMARSGWIARVVLALCVVVALPVPAPLRAQGPVPGGGVSAVEGRRAFEHARHRRVDCEICHSRDERHRSRMSWTAADCAACHHRNEPPAGCLACHDPADLTAPRTRAVPLALSVWDGVRERELSFEHGRHQGVACLDCHGGGMSRPPRSCAECHVNHHRADADCAGCHPTPDPAPHGLAVHESCAGGGCHDAATTVGIERARPACLLCHQEKREHKPGRPCAACHVLPRTSGRETS